MKHDQSVTPGPSGVSRRTVVKGAAWAVPAIAVASAVPAVAFSQPCVAPPATINGCKYPGNSTDWEKVYRAPVTFTNNCGRSVTLSLVNATWGGGDPGSFQFLVTPENATAQLPAGSYDVPVAPAVGGTLPTFTLASGASQTFWVFWRYTGNSANATLFLNYNVSDGVAPDPQLSQSQSFVNFGPDCDCSAPQPPYEPDTCGKLCTTCP